MNEVRIKHPNIDNYKNSDKDIIIRIYKNKYTPYENWE